jgi:hypothetical protein
MTAFAVIRRAKLLNERHRLESESEALLLEVQEAKGEEEDEGLRGGGETRTEGGGEKLLGGGRVTTEEESEKFLDGGPDGGRGKGEGPTRK